MKTRMSKKEVHQLTERLAALSQLLSWVGDNVIHFFSTIQKSSEFTWTEECEKAFVKVKQFLYAQLMLVHPKENSPLTLYLSVLENPISSTLVLDREKCERPIYFVSKVRKVAYLRY